MTTFTDVQEARANTIRRIFATVFDRSLGGTRPGTRLRRDLDIRGAHEDEVARLLKAELGVAISPLDWSEFSTIGDVIQHVEISVQRAYAERD